MDTVDKVVMAKRAATEAHRDGGTLFEQLPKALTCA